MASQGVQQHRPNPLTHNSGNKLSPASHIAFKKKKKEKKRKENMVITKQ